MSDGRSQLDGTGRGIVSIHRPTSTVLDTRGLGGKFDSGLPRGCFTKTTGTIKVKLFGMDTPVEIDVFAGSPNFYDIESIYDDGVDLPITDITLYW